MPIVAPLGLMHGNELFDSTLGIFRARHDLVFNRKIFVEISLAPPDLSPVVDLERGERLLPGIFQEGSRTIFVNEVLATEPVPLQRFVQESMIRQPVRAILQVDHVEEMRLLSEVRRDHFGTAFLLVWLKQNIEVIGRPSADEGKPLIAHYAEDTNTFHIKGCDTHHFIAITQYDDVERGRRVRLPEVFPPRPLPLK